MFETGMAVQESQEAFQAAAVGQGRPLTASRHDGMDSRPQLRLTFSTAWNGTRHPDPTAAIQEILALGFDRVELYAHFTQEQLLSIQQTIAPLGLAITSLHSPCPVPVDPGTGKPRWGDWLASTDEAERRWAVDGVKRTVDWAARLGARAVVVHLGHVKVNFRQRQVFELVDSMGRDHPDTRALVREVWEERQQNKGPYLDQALRSIGELGEHARGTGVIIGVEARDGYHEIPSLDEMGDVLAATRGLPVGYWHDAGHGQKLDNAGFLEHQEYLRRYHAQMVGIHLHDTIGGRDHLAPGQGRTDFTVLARYIGPDVIRTLELSPSVPVDHIVPGVEVLRKAGIY